MKEMYPSGSLPEFLLKANDVAEILNISVPMAYRLMQRNEIRTVSIGKSRRVREEDLFSFIEENLSSEN
jgi:excisionase family DNA binding protein